jgi:hypothetical protein
MDRANEKAPPSGNSGALGVGYSRARGESRARLINYPLKTTVK